MNALAEIELTGVQEDYLEAILTLIHEGRVARVRDIARRLDVGMPSVTAALKTLSRHGLVNYDPYELVTLTDLGQRCAEGVSRRHRILMSFLTDVLGLDAATADANACRMEHGADEAVMDRLTQFAEFLQSRSRAGSQLVESFRRYCAPGGRKKEVRR